MKAIKYIFQMMMMEVIVNQSQLSLEGQLMWGGVELHVGTTLNHYMRVKSYSLLIICI